MSLLSSDAFRDRWQRRIGAARIAWGRLTEDELLKTEGQVQKLAELIKERYGVTRDEAKEQVNSVLQNCTN